MLNLLIVEDHQMLCETLQETFETEGYIVSAYNSVEEVPLADLEQPWHIALLDINLPGEDGISFSYRLRAQLPGIGIVMLTSHQSLEWKLNGYESGADVYLTKPIDPLELLAVTNSLTKRLQFEPNTSVDWRLEIVEHKLIGPNGQTIALTPNEVQVLHHFIFANQHQLEYWQLLEITHNQMDEAGRKRLEVMISRLRSKLAQIDSCNSSIKALRGYGYVLCLNIQCSEPPV